MRKSVLAAALVLMSLCFGERLSAGNFGVLGGANFRSAGLKEAGPQTLTQWHAGMVYKFGLPLGFQIQPTLLYNVKPAAEGVSQMDLSIGYLEFLASLQWGVDLILFRPFIEVSPFVGYGINGWGDLRRLWESDGDRLEYGVGVGGGLQIWRFQINARYNWNFGNISAVTRDASPLSHADIDGVTLSLAYFF